MKHGERKHSKFSASGAERWFKCAGSVELSEGVPRKDSVWSIEGTKAHEVLEVILRNNIAGRANVGQGDMFQYGSRAASFIMSVHLEAPRSEILVESRVHLEFIHPEMFGTFDGAVVDHFGTLHVFDYKYGAGVPVSPKENLQMITYGMGVAHKYDWNFKRVRLWIIQPRIKSYDGPIFWELGIMELLDYVPKFQAAVKRVIAEPEKYVEGSWCHWCSAKRICPLKQQGKIEKAKSVFTRI